MKVLNSKSNSKLQMLHSFFKAVLIQHKCSLKISKSFFGEDKKAFRKSIFSNNAQEAGPFILKDFFVFLIKGSFYFPSNKMIF